jgi:hypothetical protein
MGMCPISLGWRLRDAESRATITRVSVVSLDAAARGSFGRASVLLHPDAITAIGRTAASRRYLEYGCTWELASKRAGWRGDAGSGVS